MSNNNTSRTSSVALAGVTGFRGCFSAGFRAGALLIGVFVASIASTVLGHNLDTRATGIAFEKSFLTTITTRAATNAANLVQVNDEFWVILKTTPVTTTATGVGGYQTFYVPTGVQVTGAEIIEPDPANPGGFRTIPAHGQSIIAGDACAVHDRFLGAAEEVGEDHTGSIDAVGEHRGARLGPDGAGTDGDD